MVHIRGGIIPSIIAQVILVISLLLGAVGRTSPYFYIIPTICLIIAGYADYVRSSHRRLWIALITLSFVANSALLFLFALLWASGISSFIFALLPMSLFLYIDNWHTIAKGKRLRSRWVLIPFVAMILIYSLIPIRIGI